MFYKCLNLSPYQVLSLLLPLTASSPQYGGGGSSQPVTAPSNTNTQVSCWTEQATVWDTQDMETETQKCQTVPIAVCSYAEAGVQDGH